MKYFNYLEIMILAKVFSLKKITCNQLPIYQLNVQIRREFCSRANNYLEIVLRIMLQENAVIVILYKDTKQKPLSKGVIYITFAPHLKNMMKTHKYRIVRYHTAHISDLYTLSIHN